MNAIQPEKTATKWEKTRFQKVMEDKTPAQHVSTKAIVLSSSFIGKISQWKCKTGKITLERAYAIFEWKCAISECLSLDILSQ